jgi:hypothetical protein
MSASTMMTRPNAATTAESNSRVRALARQNQVEVTPRKPDQQLWKTDEERAFEAGLQWFLAVSRTA